jgi:protein-disulfide isomerase
MSSRQEQKAAARAAREESQQQSADAQRRRRLLQLGGALVVAAIVAVVVVVVASGGGSSSPSETKTTDANAPGAQSAQLLAGIPEKGLTLGKASAPVTLIEFNDMQCPICRDYSNNVFPTLARDYVRTGKLRMEMRLQSFIGPDSVTGGKAVAAAAAQNRAWRYSDSFYDNQQEENSGYVTDEFLSSIAKGIPGLDAARVLQDKNTPAAAATLKAGTAAFDANHFEGTPSFLIGKTGGPMTVLNWNQLTPAEFTGPIDRLLGS